MLTKGTTGLGVIQKPLRDKYFAFRKSPDNKLGPEIGIRVNPRGILLMFPGARPGEPNDEFYELPSVHFIEAVHFVTDKFKNKKLHGAFLPIDIPLDPSQEKLFEQIDKKFSHLAKIQHPPMLACVMRRPTGVRAVDCHMFVIPVVEDALQMVSMVHRFQERPMDPEFYDRPPPHRMMDRPDPDVIPRNIGPPTSDPRQRNSTEDYEIYRGRGLNLRQEHFIGNGSRPADLRIEESNKSLDSDRGPPSTRGYDKSPIDDPRDFRRPQSSPSPRFENREFAGDRSSREVMKPNGAFVERDTHGREHEFDNRIIHDRQRSGGSSNDRFEMDRSGPQRNDFANRSGDFANRSGDFANRSGDFPNRSGDFANRSGDFPNRSGDIPNRSGDFANRSGEVRGPHNRSGERSPEPYRGAPPPWQGPRLGQRTGGRDYDDGHYPNQYRGDGRRSPPGMQRGRSPPRSNSPPRGHSSPRSPRAMSPTPDDNMFSASNLESRIEESHSKPVAKVIPNRHAGVRVLPSLPLLGAKNLLKPVSPKNPDQPSKIEDKPPSYNFNAKVEDDDDDDDNPYDNAQDKRYLRQNRVQSERSPDIQRRDYSNRLDPRVKSDDYSYERESSRRENGNARNLPKQWSYEGEKEKFLKNRDMDTPSWNSGYKSQPVPQTTHDRNDNSDFRQGGSNMKELEIADMFSGLRASNKSRDVDFESSLGYLP